MKTKLVFMFIALLGALTATVAQTINPDDVIRIQPAKFSLLIDAIHIEDTDNDKKELRVDTFPCYMRLSVHVIDSFDQNNRKLRNKNPEDYIFIHFQDLYTKDDAIVVANKKFVETISNGTSIIKHNVLTGSKKHYKQILVTTPLGKIWPSEIMLHAIRKFKRKRYTKYSYHIVGPYPMKF
jgi:hypothetical protein